MLASTWLDRVDQSLREYGIPERHRRQFLEELADHLTDLQEAKMNRELDPPIDELMGEPAPLADGLADGYFRQRRLARHPWLACLAFTVGPLAFHSVFSAVFCLISLFIVLGSLHAYGAQAVAAVQAVVAAGVTAWFCLAARRNRLSWRMSLWAAFVAAMSFPILLLCDLGGSWPYGLDVTAGIFGATLILCLGMWYLLAWRNQAWNAKAMSLSRRFPILANGAVGVLMVFTCVIAYLLAVGGFVQLLENRVEREWIVANVAPLVSIARFLPFLAAAYFAWRIAQRCKRPLLGSFAGCITVAILGSMTFTRIGMTPDGKGEIQFGLGVASVLGWQMLTQFLTPIAAWGILSLLRWRSYRPTVA